MLNVILDFSYTVACESAQLNRENSIIMSEKISHD